MKLTISSAFSFLEGDDATLTSIHNHFSFHDKGAQNELKRFKSTLMFKERSLQAEHGELPDDYRAWKEARLSELKAAITVHCCTLRANRLTVPNGLLVSLFGFLGDRLAQVQVIDERDFDLPKRLLKGEKPRELRKPQKIALAKILGATKLPDIGIGLIRLATGVGKTALAQELIREIGCPSIFVVPSLPILNQTVRRYEDAFGRKNVKAYGGGDKSIGYITVATYQSIYAGDPDDFKDIRMAIFDEVHHIGADTFYDVATVKLKHAIRRYGLTAFEERADGATLLVESAVGPVLYAYDAPEAIEDKLLARPTFMIYDVWATQGSWTKYKTKAGKRVASGIEASTAYNGDDDIKAYRNWILGNDKLNEFVRMITADMVADGKSVLILVDEKEHGERLMGLIPHAGFAIGGGKDNERLQKDFNARKLKVLIGTSTLGEGADTVPVDMLINLQGGASKSKTLQVNGRALRNDPDENGVPRKSTTLIVDFNFPMCDMLARQSAAREKVHKDLGKIHRGKLV